MVVGIQKFLKKKMVLLFLQVVVLVFGISLLIPQLSHAQFGQRVPVVDEEQIGVSTEIYELLYRLVEKEYELDPDAEAQAKEALAEDTSEEIEFIQTGFRGYLNNKFLPGGEPVEESVFVSDPDKFLGDVVTSEHYRFMTDFFDADISDPESVTLNPESRPGQYLDVVAQSLEARRSGTDPEEAYTLLEQFDGDEVRAQNFLNGDFSEGGWSGWLSLTQNPNNNVYGTYLSAKRTSDARAGRAVNREQQILEYGEGHHATRNEAGAIVTPGILNREKIEKAVSTCKTSLESVDEYVGGADSTTDSLEEMCQILQNGLNSEDGLLNLETFDFASLFNLDFNNLLDSIVGDIFSGSGLGGFGF